MKSFIELRDACDADPTLDRTFLKAWELDASNFATRLDVADAGIIEHVATEFVISTSNQGRCRWVHALQLFSSKPFDLTVILQL